LSRIDPAELSYARVGSGDYLTLSAAPETNAIALSMIMVNKCVLTYLPTNDEGGQKRKEISGHFHSQELERIMGVLGLVYGRDHFKPSVYHSAVQFTTIPLAHSFPKTGMYIIFAYTSLN
jgi:hypothetical protein